VFLLNSRYLFLYDIINKLTTLLLPKLQSDFAEFLQLLSLIATIYSTNPPVSVFIYLTSSYSNNSRNYYYRSASLLTTNPTNKDLLNIYTILNSTQMVKICINKNLPLYLISRCINSKNDLKILRVKSY